MRGHLDLTALAFRENDWHVAQVVEHDIAAQARTEEALREELGRIVTAHAALGYDIEKNLRGVTSIQPTPAMVIQRIQRRCDPKTLRVTVELDGSALRVAVTPD